MSGASISVDAGEVTDGPCLREASTVLLASHDETDVNKGS
jgi:hypothetical protein